MDMNLLAAGFAVWTFACVAFGWWVRGHENASIAADDVDAPYSFPQSVQWRALHERDIHSGPGDVEKRARRAF